MSWHQDQCAQTILGGVRSSPPLSSAPAGSQQAPEKPVMLRQPCR